MATKDAATRVLESLLRSIENARTQNEILQLCNQSWRQLVEAQATDTHFNKLDKGIAERQKQLMTALGTICEHDLPKMQRGHYVAPTPTLGDIVFYHPRGDRSVDYVGIVTVREMPGMLELSIVKPQGSGLSLPDYVKGVRHVSDPEVHATHQTVITQGLWSYRNKQVPEGDYEWARERIAAREERFRDEAANRAERERLFRENQKQIEEGPRPIETV